VLGLYAIVTTFLNIVYYYTESRSNLFESMLSFADSLYPTNSYFIGKIGRLAPEDVTLQLIQSKCIPSLLYGPEVCYLNKADLNGLDFVINRFFIKLLSTNNINTVRDSVVAKALDVETETETEAPGFETEAKIELRECQHCRSALLLCRCRVLSITSTRNITSGRTFSSSFTSTTPNRATTPH